MKRNLCVGAAFLALIAALGFGSRVLEKRAAVEAATVQAPMFEVDPMWPKPLPNHWVIGQTIGVSVDAQDHIWIIHRAGSLEPKETYSIQNPPARGMLHACAARSRIRPGRKPGAHWGGPGTRLRLADVQSRNHRGLQGQRLDWRQRQRLRRVWAPKLQARRHGPEVHQDGKFLMQIGHPDQSKGSNDTENLKGPAKMFVDPGDQ